MTARPRLLDLFCGAGGAAMGYYRAGFEIVGVDSRPQPSYPFRFVQGDAVFTADVFTLLNFSLGPFAAIHASPPCQRYSAITRTSGDPESHPDLIAPVRAQLVATGLPYVIENVPRAPLHEPFVLCGTMFGLRLGEYVLRRHRGFESNVFMLAPPCCCHPGDGTTLGVYGGGTSTKERNPNTNGGRPYKGRGDERKRIMGMEWCATNAEVNEAIPPAYTEWIGAQLLAAIERVPAWPLR
jgi:DNA (cytosine-5)-methyltransferase 1